MFKREGDFVDLSVDLRDVQDFKPGILRSFDFASQVTALAVDPSSGFLAFGKC